MKSRNFVSDQELNEGLKEARRIEKDIFERSPNLFTFVNRMRKTHEDFKAYVREPYLSIYFNPVVKQTKRELRKNLRHCHMKMVFLGNVTMRIYANSIVQSFFEFAIHYSALKQKSFSFMASRSVFLRASKVSLGLSLQENETTKQMQEIVDFMSGQMEQINHSQFPTGNVGRPTGPTEYSKKIDRKIRQGLSARDIVEDLYPNRPQGDRRQLEQTIRKQILRQKKRRQ